MKTRGIAKRLFMVIVMAGALAVAGFAEPKESSATVSEPDGKVIVEGTATIYGQWACEGQAMVNATPGIALEPVPGFPGGVQTTMVTVSVQAIECGDNTMNKHLRRALKEKDHPKINF